MKLNEILKEYEEEERRTTYLTLLPEKIRITDSGSINIGGREFTLAESAETQLARFAGIPSEFFKGIPPKLKAINFNTLFPEEITSSMTNRFKAIVKDNTLRGLTDESLIILPAHTVLTNILNNMPEKFNGELDIKGFSQSEGSFILNLTTPKFTAEPRKGDFLCGGISIRHSAIGEFSTQVSTYIHRLACKNGMVVPICENNRQLRIRRLDVMKFSRDDLLNRISYLSNLAWNELEKKVEIFSTLQNVKIDLDAFIRKLATIHHLSKKIVKAVIEALYEDELGQENSLYSVVLAFSRVATHRLDLLGPFEGNQLMRLSGLLSQERHMKECPYCHSLLWGHEDIAVN